MKTSNIKKKINLQLTAVIIAVFAVSHLQSQGFYISAGGGYGLPAAPSLNGSYEHDDFEIDEYSTLKGSGTLGKGFQVGGAFGYMLNENIGAELGIMYLAGTKLKQRDYNTGGIDNSYHSEFSEKATILRFIPAIKITTGKHNLKPYLKTGVIIGIAGKIYYSYSSLSSNLGTHQYEREIEFSGNTSFGFSGSIGVEYKLNTKFGFYAEFNIITQSWAPGKSVMTKSEWNGVDDLPSMTTSEKETIYVDSYTNEGLDDPSSPSKALKEYMPLSSIGMNVGVHFNFVRKKE